MTYKTLVTRSVVTRGPQLTNCSRLETMVQRNVLLVLFVILYSHLVSCDQYVTGVVYQDNNVAESSPQFVNRDNILAESSPQYLYQDNIVAESNPQYLHQDNIVAESGQYQDNIVAESNLGVVFPDNIAAEDNTLELYESSKQNLNNVQYYTSQESENTVQQQQYAGASQETQPIYNQPGDLSSICIKYFSLK